MRVDIDVGTSPGTGGTLLAFLTPGHNLIGLDGVGGRAAVARNVAIFLFGMRRIPRTGYDDNAPFHVPKK
jgi:hypothetical protein